jgi:hypothetical protein
MKRKSLFVAIFFLLLNVNISANTLIKVVAKVDNIIITNYDLQNIEKEILSKIKKKLNQKELVELKYHVLKQETENIIKEKFFEMQNINYLNYCKKKQEKNMCLNEVWLGMLFSSIKQNYNINDLSKKQVDSVLMTENDKMLKKIKTIFLIEIFQENL